MTEKERKFDSQFWASIRTNDLAYMKEYCQNNPPPLCLVSPIIKALNYPYNTQAQIVEFLIEVGYSVNDYDGRNLYNALMTACLYSNGIYTFSAYLKTIPVILKAKDLNLYAKDKKDNTALDLVINQNNIKAINALIEHGVKIENCKPENQEKYYNYLLKKKLEQELLDSNIIKKVKI
jgi:ankyrin repeat protein